MTNITRPQVLGIKLSAEEEQALITIAKNDGVQKSTYARRILRQHLISLGAIRINNPAQLGDEITTLVQHD